MNGTEEKPRIFRPIDSLEQQCHLQQKRLRDARAALSLATAQRTAIEQTAVNAIITVDAAGKVLSCNTAAEKMFGYSASELLQHPVSRILPEKYHVHHEGGVRRSLGEGHIHALAHPIETRGVTKNGEEIPLEISLSIWSSGGEQFYTGIARDISWKRRTEAQTENYIRQLEAAFASTVEAVTVISEKCDPYTVGHERRVAEVAVALGRELGFTAHRQEGLRVAGCLHDVGKISLPAEILCNPGRLSALELSFIKQHADFGYDVLRNIRSEWDLATMVHQHHERMDGTGYPRGLKDDEISLEARILAVADVVEAMSSHRPYRAGLGIDVALQEIESGAGIRYDKDVAGACSHLFRDTGFSIPMIERRKVPRPE